MKNHWLQKKYKGFPQDDEFSIQQGCCGNIKCNCGANLDLYYRYQYIQNETVRAWHIWDGLNVEYTPTECTPVLPESITGTVLYNGKAIQTFYYTNTIGSFVINSIGTPDVYVKRANLIGGNVFCKAGSDSNILHTTGQIVTRWNVPLIEKTELVINYDYHVEPNE